LILLVALSTTVFLMILVLSGCCNLPHDIGRQNESSVNNYQQSRFENAISQQSVPENKAEGLPGNISEITSDKLITRQVGESLISSREAKEIAVDFVGYGVVHDITAFRDEGVLVFEVDIRYDTLQYVVQLSAETGGIESLNRHEKKPVNDEILRDVDKITGSGEIAQENTPTAIPSVKKPSVTTHSGGEHENQRSGSTISLEKAKEIAYADLAVRGINASYRSNSGIDREKGQWVWELLFRTTGERMPFIEYYINAENGNIVKFEWDD